MVGALTFAVGFFAACCFCQVLGQGARERQARFLRFVVSFYARRAFDASRRFSFHDFGWFFATPCDEFSDAVKLDFVGEFLPSVWSVVVIHRGVDEPRGEYSPRRFLMLVADVVLPAERSDYSSHGPAARMFRLRFPAVVLTRRLRQMVVTPLSAWRLSLYDS